MRMKHQFPGLATPENLFQQIVFFWNYYQPIQFTPVNKPVDAICYFPRLNAVKFCFGAT
jgi:hypothetical protein